MTNLAVNTTFDAGTTTTDTYDLTANDLVIQGSDDQNPAIIDGTDSGSFTINTGTATGAIIRNLDLRNAVRRGIYLSNGTTAGNTSNTLIDNVTITGVDGDVGLDGMGIQAYGTGITIRNTVIRDVGDDGIWIAGIDPTIEGVFCDNVDNRLGTNGDPLQFAERSAGLRVANCFLHHDLDSKQCIIINTTSAETTNARIEDCELQGFAGGGGTAQIAYNQSRAGSRCDLYRIKVKDSRRAFSLSGTNETIEGSIAQDGASSAGTEVSIYSLATGQSITHCTVVGGERGIRVTNDLASTVKNCISINNSGYGIVHFGTVNAVENFNCAFNNTTDNISWGGGVGADSIEVDPLLINVTAGDFRLQGNSPCIGAGEKYWSPGSQPHGYDGLRFPIRTGFTSVSLGSELVTDGVMSVGPVGDNWLAGNSATLSLTGGRLRVTNSESAGNGSALTVTKQTITTVIGDEYQFKVDGFVGDSGGWRVAVTNNAGDTPVVDLEGADLDHTFTTDRSFNTIFVANDTTTQIILATGSAGPSEYSEFDNLTMKGFTGTRRGPDMGAFPVRPGLDGAVRGSYTLPASYLEAGFEVPKAKQAP